MKRVLALFVTVAVFACCVNLRAGEESTEQSPAKEKELGPRQMIYKLVKGVNDLYLEERVNNILELGKQSDRDLIKEFDVTNILIKVAESTDRRRFPRERSAALRALFDLASAGVIDVQIVPILTKILDSDETPEIVKLDALILLGELGGGEFNPITGSAFNALESLWKKRRASSTNRLSERLIVSIIQTIGGFNTNPGCKNILLEGIAEKNNAIRAGAIRGIRSYVDASGDSSADIFKAITSMITNVDDKNVKMEAILTLKTLIDNGAKADNLKNIKKMMIEMLETGSDDEVCAATRLLMVIADNDVVEKIRITAWPKPERKLSLKTYTELSMALLESINRLVPVGKKDKPSAKDKEAVDSIAEHFIKIINPKNSVPKELRKSAIFALGCWPVDFDRTKTVALLIHILKIETDQDLIKEAENSLKYLTMRDPFRKVEPDTQKEVPDVEAWQKLYDEIKDQFKAGEKIK
jgi:hypothetical protein